MRSVDSRLPKSWRDDIRASLPDDDLLPPWRDHFLDWVTTQIEVELSRYFQNLEWGENENPPAPKDVADRAVQLKSETRPLLEDLRRIHDPKSREQWQMSSSILTAFKKHGFNLSDLYVLLARFEGAAELLASDYDRPNPNRRPTKTADRWLTRGVAQVWEEAYGKPPVISGRKDSTFGGAFFKLLMTVEHLVGGSYRASGQAQWWRQLRR